MRICVYASIPIPALYKGPFRGKKEKDDNLRVTIHSFRVFSTLGQVRDTNDGYYEKYTGFHGPRCHCGQSTCSLHSCAVGPFGPSFSTHWESSTIERIPPATTCSHLISLVCKPPSPQCLLHSPHSPSTHSAGHGSSLQVCVSSGSSCGSHRLSSTGWLSRLRTHATLLD